MPPAFFSVAFSQLQWFPPPGDGNHPASLQRGVGAHGVVNAGRDPTHWHPLADWVSSWPAVFSQPWLLFFQRDLIPKGLVVVSFLRHQSGLVFGRICVSFVFPFNWVCFLRFCGVVWCDKQYLRLDWVFFYNFIPERHPGVHWGGVCMAQPSQCSATNCPGSFSP